MLRAWHLQLPRVHGKVNSGLLTSDLFRLWGLYHYMETFRLTPQILSWPSSTPSSHWQVLFLKYKLTYLPLTCLTFYLLSQRGESPNSFTWYIKTLYGMTLHFSPTSCRSASLRPYLARLWSHIGFSSFLKYVLLSWVRALFLVSLIYLHTSRGPQIRAFPPPVLLPQPQSRSPSKYIDVWTPPSPLENHGSQHSVCHRC